MFSNIRCFSASCFSWDRCNSSDNACVVERGSRLLPPAVEGDVRDNDVIEASFLPFLAFFDVIDLLDLLPDL